MSLKNRISTLEKIHKRNTPPDLEISIGGIEILENGIIYTFLTENGLSVEVETLKDRQERLKNGDRIIRISSEEEEESEVETEEEYLKRVSDRNISLLKDILSEEEVMRLFAELKPGDKKLL